jgi:formamidopyrimidine-DNA glycosylase
MPELPEVDSACTVIADRALQRRIVAVDDTDTYVCRPHAPGDIAAALVGRQLLSVHRRGKSLWCETSPVGRRSGPAGPTLGIHLGMSGKIVIVDADGAEVDGGDYWDRGRAKGDYRHHRFGLDFADGGRLLLVDPRRLGRIRLDPDVSALGPDAATVTAAQFRAAISTGTAPVKARLLDQHAIAGIGNLLADQILWQAGVHPARPVGSLTRVEQDALHRATRAAIRAAVRGGGVHTLRIVAQRRPGGLCPRDGAPMQRATIGGRTTWWCPAEQRR